MLYDIVIDWLYLIVTSFVILVCLYVLHLIFFELDIPGLIVHCASKIEEYFWTSIFFVSLMTLITHDRMENKRRYRHYINSSYDDGTSRKTTLFYQGGQSETSKLKQSKQGVVAKALDSITTVGEVFGLTKSADSKHVSETFNARKAYN